jgi:hypothetical protein
MDGWGIGKERVVMIDKVNGVICTVGKGKGREIEQTINNNKDFFFWFHFIPPLLPRHFLLPFSN